MKTFLPAAAISSFMAVLFSCSAGPSVTTQKSSPSAGKHGAAIPPGQAKKMYGGSAKDYAPGQVKKQGAGTTIIYYPLIIIKTPGIIIARYKDGRNYHVNKDGYYYWEGTDGRFYLADDAVQKVRYSDDDYTHWKQEKDRPKKSNDHSGESKGKHKGKKN